MEDDLKKNTNQSAKINLTGCDTIVNSPSWELIDEDIAQVKLDERKKVEDFQRYKEVKDVEGDTIEAQLVAKGF